MGRFSDVMLIADIPVKSLGVLVRTSSWVMYVVPGIAQPNGLGLYYCCPPGTT